MASDCSGVIGNDFNKSLSQPCCSHPAPSMPYNFPLIRFGFVTAPACLQLHRLRSALLCSSQRKAPASHPAKRQVIGSCPATSLHHAGCCSAALTGVEQLCPQEGRTSAGKVHPAPWQMSQRKQFSQWSMDWCLPGDSGPPPSTLLLPLLLWDLLVFALAASVSCVTDQLGLHEAT